MILRLAVLVELRLLTDRHRRTQADGWYRGCIASRGNKSIVLFTIIFGTFSFPVRFAQGFVDVREREMNHPRRSRALAAMLMNVHNNDAGRKVPASSRLYIG